MRGALVIAAVLIVRSVAAAELQAVAGPPQSAINIDGKLDDAAWTGAASLLLIQQSPHPGQPTPFVTELRVLANPQTIYFGFQCTDPSPADISIHTMQHDGDMDADDTVGIVIDTFGDQRTGYFFGVNAAGARTDGLVETAEVISLDWDGIWNARVARSASGWSAEIAIPTTSLRFDPTLKQWGFNAQRYVARERLTLRWSGQTLDARLPDFRRAGLLEVPPLRQGRGIWATANEIARRTRDFRSDDRAITNRIGLDLGYNVTPQLGALLTINTDFAETEVDTRQINLTRFPLFFPEKRSFFLEGSNQFRFGIGLSSNFLPFYSRRVGLVRGEIVPLNGGLKVLGRAGKWGVAALGVRTGATGDIDRENLFAGRITYDATSHLRVGTVITAGDPTGTTENHLAGVDAVWRTSTLFGDKNFGAGAWFAHSGGDDAEGQHDGWGWGLDYDNDLWDIYLSINQYGDALRPALGFLPRPGTRHYRFDLSWRPRPRDSWIRQHFFQFLPLVVKDLDGRTVSWRVFISPFNVESTTGVDLQVNYVPEFQRIDEPFEIAEGTVIPPGSYRFDRLDIEAESSPARPLRVGTAVSFGTFYDGRLTQIENFIGWTERSGRLQLELAAENDFGHLRSGNFAQRLLQSKIVYAASPNLVFSSYTQYDTDSRQVGVNNRVRWTFRPEADLFIVWNRDWLHRIGDNENLSPVGDQIVVKLRWTVRR